MFYIGGPLHGQPAPTMDTSVTDRIVPLGQFRSMVFVRDAELPAISDPDPCGVYRARWMPRGGLGTRIRYWVWAPTAVAERETWVAEHEADAVHRWFRPAQQYAGPDPVMFWLASTTLVRSATVVYGLPVLRTDHEHLGGVALCERPPGRHLPTLRHLETYGQDF